MYRKYGNESAASAAATPKATSKPSRPMSQPMGIATSPYGESAWNQPYRSELPASLGGRAAIEDTFRSGPVESYTRRLAAPPPDAPKKKKKQLPSTDPNAPPPPPKSK